MNNRLDMLNDFLGYPRRQEPETPQEDIEEATSAEPQSTLPLISGAEIARILQARTRAQEAGLCAFLWVFYPIEGQHPGMQGPAMYGPNDRPATSEVDFGLLYQALYARVRLSGQSPYGRWHWDLGQDKLTLLKAFSEETE